MSIPEIIKQYISDIADSASVDILPFTAVNELVKSFEENRKNWADWSFSEPSTIERNSVFPPQKWLQPPSVEETVSELIDFIKNVIPQTSAVGLANITCFIHRVSWTDKEISELMKAVEPERWRETLRLITNGIAEFFEKDEKPGKESLSLHEWHDLLMNTQFETRIYGDFCDIIGRIAWLTDITLFELCMDALPERLRAGLCAKNDFCPKRIEDISRVVKDNRYKGLIANLVITKSLPANDEIMLEILSEEGWDIFGAQFVERILILEKPNVFYRNHDDGENDRLIGMTEKALSKIILEQERDWAGMVRDIRWPECVELLTAVDEKHTELLVDHFSGPLIEIMTDIWKTHRNSIIKRTLEKDYNDHSSSWFFDPMHMRSQLAINILSLCLITTWKESKKHVISMLSWCQGCFVSPKASFYAARFGGEIFLLLIVALEYISEAPELCEKQSDIEQLALNFLVPFVGYWEAHDSPWDGKVALSLNKNLFLIDWHMGELKKKNIAKSLIDKWVGIATAKWPWMEDDSDNSE